MSLTDQSMKKDDGKTPLQLLPFRALTEVAKVLEFGARKYAPHRWRDGMNWSRLIGGLFRHMFKWSEGEERDPETGLSHLAHATCNVLFLLEYVLEGKGTDDRFKRNQAKAKASS